MQCHQCNNHIVNLGDLTCSFCGASLYWFELPSPLLYQTGGMRLSVRLINKGPDPYLLESLVLGTHEVASPGVNVGSDQSLDHTVQLPGGLPLGSFPVTFKIRFSGRLEYLLPITRSQEVQLLELPVLEAPDRLEIKPSRSYRVALPVKLLNAARTRCTIQSAFLLPGSAPPPPHAWFDSQGGVAANGHLGLTLGHLPGGTGSDEATLALSFDPPSAPGKSLVRLRLEDGGQTLLEKDLELAIFALPRVQVQRGEWQREAFQFDPPLPPSHRIMWRAPSDLKVGKRLHLTCDTQAVSPDLLDLPVQVKLESPGIEFHPETVIFYDWASVDLILQGLSSAEWEALPEQPGEERFQDSRLILTTSAGREEYGLQLRRFPSQDAQYNLSLDFGTTGSCVAMALPNDRGVVPNPGTLNTVAIDFASPAYLLPSRITRRDDHILVGSDVPVTPDFNPIKPRMFREIGPEREQCVADARLLMQTCLERAINWLVDQDRVKEILFRRLVLAVPTSFPLLWKENLREICREAGDEVFGAPQISLVEESMAAVRYFLHQDPAAKDAIADKDLIVVVDFGGGSSDITFLRRRQEDSYTLKPILHGGMRDFAGFRLDRLIQEWLQQEKLVEQVNVIFTESLKRSLGSEEKFCSILEDIGIREKNRKLKAFTRISALIKTTLVEKFQNCFQALLHRARRKMGQDQAPPRVLLLLAGNSSLLHGFPDHIKAAWMGAVKEELNNGWGPPEVVRMQEPKRCVALGGFLTYVYQHTETPLHNSVPEDILLAVSDRFTPQADEEVVDFNHGIKYLVLFEAGADLDAGHQIQRVISASRLDFVPGEASCRDLDLYSCFPGEEPERYVTLPCEPSPGQTTIDELVFTYNPGGPGKLVNITPRP